MATQDDPKFLVDSLRMYAALTLPANVAFFQRDAALTTQTWFLELIDKIAQALDVVEAPPVIDSLDLSAEPQNLPPGEIQVSLINRSIRVDQKLPIVIKSANDVAGNDVPDIPNAMVWSMDDLDAGTLQIADDTLSAMFTPAGKLGFVTVSISTNSDADPNGPVLKLISKVIIEITPGEAVSLVVEAIPQDDFARDLEAIANDPANGIETPPPPPPEGDGTDVPPADAPAPPPADAPAPPPADDGTGTNQTVINT